MKKAKAGTVENVMMRIEVNPDAYRVPVVDLTWMPPDGCDMDPQTLVGVFPTVEEALSHSLVLVSSMLKNTSANTVLAGWLFVDVADAYREECAGARLDGMGDA